MTMTTPDRPQAIPSREATLLTLARAPFATVELSEEEEACAREIDAQRKPGHCSER